LTEEQKITAFIFVLSALSVAGSGPGRKRSGSCRRRCAASSAAPRLIQSPKVSTVVIAQAVNDNDAAQKLSMENSDRIKI
jgi:hypothetical protein